jgi:uncharacterized phage-associated protein
MASVDDVAATILDTYGPADPLKLQKLLYYVQAWSLAWRDRPLFEEPIEAWQYGPVVEQIYQRYKKYGYDPIERSEAGSSANLSSEELETLRAVVDEYWIFAGTTLSDLTHSEPPWVEARQGLPDDARSRREISRESMKQNYRARATFSHPLRRPLIDSDDERVRRVVEEGSGEALQALIEQTLHVRVGG